MFLPRGFPDKIFMKQFHVTLYQTDVGNRIYLSISLPFATNFFI